MLRWVHDDRGWLEYYIGRRGYEESSSWHSELLEADLLQTIYDHVLGCHDIRKAVGFSGWNIKKDIVVNNERRLLILIQGK